MYQGSFETHLSAERGDPRGREARRATLYDAMQVIRAAHDVDEAAAYTILVQASVDTHSSLCQAARQVLDDSVETPDAQHPRLLPGGTRRGSS